MNLTAIYNWLGYITDTTLLFAYILVLVHIRRGESYKFLTVVTSMLLAYTVFRFTIYLPFSSKAFFWVQGSTVGLAFCFFCVAH